VSLNQISFAVIVSSEFCCHWVK